MVGTRLSVRAFDFDCAAGEGGEQEANRGVAGSCWSVCVDLCGGDCQVAFWRIVSCLFTNRSLLIVTCFPTKKAAKEKETHDEGVNDGDDPKHVVGIMVAQLLLLSEQMKGVLGSCRSSCRRWP